MTGLDLRKVNDQLREALGKKGVAELDGPGRDDRPLRERLNDVLHKPREKLEIEDKRQMDNEDEIEKDTEHHRDRGEGHIM